MSADNDVPRAPEKIEKRRSSLTPKDTPTYRRLNILCVIVFALLLVALISQTITSHFLGRGTDTVWRCKKDPSWDRDICPQLLADRNPPKPIKRHLDLRSWGGRSSQFNLNDSTTEQENS
jgi:hypothetical protein